MAREPLEISREEEFEELLALHLWGGSSHDQLVELASFLNGKDGNHYRQRMSSYLDVDYFLESAAVTVVASVKTEGQPRRKILNLRSISQLSLAAAIPLVFAIAFFTQYNGTGFLLSDVERKGWLTFVDGICTQNGQILKTGDTISGGTIISGARSKCDLFLRGERETGIRIKADSHFDLNLDGPQMALDLNHGHLLIDVHGTGGREIGVKVGGLELYPLGTSFTVERKSTSSRKSRVIVSVLEGRVAFQASAGSRIESKKASNAQSRGATGIDSVEVESGKLIQFEDQLSSSGKGDKGKTDGEVVSATHRVKLIEEEVIPTSKVKALENERESILQLPAKIGEEDRQNLLLAHRKEQLPPERQALPFYQKVMLRNGKELVGQVIQREADFTIITLDGEYHLKRREIKRIESLPE